MDAQDEKNWVVVAHLTRPRGVKGELCAIALTGHLERFESLSAVRIGEAMHRVERVWYHGTQPVFKFAGVDSMTDAEPLAGRDVSIPASERFPLPEDEYYFADLIGCRVVDNASGNAIGWVTGWQDVGGPIVLELDGGRVLVPFARALLPLIDVAGREIRADLPQGLLDVNG